MGNVIVENVNVMMDLLVTDAKSAGWVQILFSLTKKLMFLQKLVLFIDIIYEFYLKPVREYLYTKLKSGDKKN